MSRVKTFITATGSYLPEKVLTNKLLEEMVDTTDDWIISRTGIKERRIAASNETTSDLGAAAARKALLKGNLSIDEIELIIVATLSPEQVFPSTACVIQKKLGATCPAFDVGASCSGMLFAIATAKGYVSAGLYKKVLVVAAEKVSSLVDYKDRSTCVLFGDGASAVVVADQKIDGQSVEIGEVNLGSDGAMHKHLEVPTGDKFLRMDGSVVFRHAVKRMTASIQLCLESAALCPKEIDYFIPHQANHRIIEALLKRFSIYKDKVHRNVERFGNTCAASIGIGLDEYFSRREGGSRYILLSTFGAGFTWGSMLLKREG